MTDVKKLSRPTKGTDKPIKTAKPVKAADGSKAGTTERTKKFFRGAWSELKKVHWPSRQELITYTAVVLISVIAVAVMIWVIDSALSWILRYLIK